MDLLSKIASPLGVVRGEREDDDHKQLIDLYGAAAYWIYHSNANGNFRATAKRHVSHAAAFNLSTALRELALSIGVSAQRLDAAEENARDCLGRGAVPVLAGSSFEEFRAAVLSAWPADRDEPTVR